MDLVIFSIGPVQSFISQARRTYDLYFGSRLLSVLAAAGAMAVPDAKNNLIYPQFTDKGTLPGSVPNRFVFLAEDGPQVAEKVKAAIDTAWQDIHATVWRHFTSGYAYDIDQKTWKRQVDYLLEIYWIAVPFDDGAYEECFTGASDLFDARKLIRQINSNAEPGDKSSVSGTHQVLYKEYTAPDDHPPHRRALRTYWEDIRSRSKKKNPSLLRPGEQLAAIDVVKRFAHEVDTQLVVDNDGRRIGRFPSTSSIATATFRANLAQHWSNISQEVLDYFECLEELNVTFSIPEPYPYLEALYNDESDVLRYFDGDFFFKESLSEKVIEDYSREDDVNQDDLRSAQRRLQRLLAKAKKLGIPAPHPYLAVLLLDGDGMGAYVGSLAETGRHQDFSTALADFADDKVPTIVENDDYAGRLIYSGGDDVLALFPIHCVLKATNELRFAFSDIMNDAGFPGLHASAGIAIVHHTHPLDLALKEAHAAESAAKKHYGRNSLCVRTIRRSGEHRMVGGPWEYQVAESLSITELVDALAKEFSTGALSLHLPFDLENLAYQMDSYDWEDDKDIYIDSNARQKMLEYYLKRRTNRALAKPEEIVEEYRDRLVSIGENQREHWNTVAGWTRLARFLAKGEEA